MIDEAVGLFALAPADFVAERNRLAKLLKSAGRLDDAQFVAGLKRPKLAEFSLNRVARDHAPIVGRLLQAIAAASDAQSAAIGGKAVGLREATTELRAATKSVVDEAVRVLTEAGNNGEGQRDDIVAVIRDVVASGEVRALSDGVLGAAAVGGDDDYFRGAPDPPDFGDRTERPGAVAEAAQRPVKKSLPPPPVGPGPADPARKIKLERQLRDATDQVGRAERAVAEAEQQLGQAKQKLDDRAAVLTERRALAAAAEADLEAFRGEWPTT